MHTLHTLPYFLLIVGITYSLLWEAVIGDQEISASLIGEKIVWRCDKKISSIIQSELSPQRNFTKV